MKLKQSVSYFDSSSDIPGSNIYREKSEGQYLLTLISTNEVLQLINPHARIGRVKKINRSKRLLPDTDLGVSQPEGRS